mmetsp:Transcript_12156/g.34203  ORF Transcript_12156/g.34203 Transcript_12156/m.34203 type:complete len:434 (+) Transcript_12156:758-2059(+)
MELLTEVCVTLQELGNLSVLGFRHPHARLPERFVLLGEGIQLGLYDTRSSVVCLADLDLLHATAAGMQLGAPAEDEPSFGCSPTRLGAEAGELQGLGQLLLQSTAAGPELIGHGAHLGLLPPQQRRLCPQLVLLGSGGSAQLLCLSSPPVLGILQGSSHLLALAHRLRQHALCLGSSGPQPLEVPLLPTVPLLLEAAAQLLLLALQKRVGAGTVLPQLALHAVHLLPGEVNLCLGRGAFGTQRLLLGLALAAGLSGGNLRLTLRPLCPLSLFLEVHNRLLHPLKLRLVLLLERLRLPLGGIQFPLSCLGSLGRLGSSVLGSRPGTLKGGLRLDGSLVGLRRLPLRRLEHGPEALQRRLVGVPEVRDVSFMLRLQLHPHLLQRRLVAAFQPLHLCVELARKRLSLLAGLGAHRIKLLLQPAGRLPRLLQICPCS